MMKRLWMVLGLLPLLFWSLPAQAVEVDTSGGWAYEQVGDAKYQLVWIKGSGGSSGTTLGGCIATAAAPTYTEGETEASSCDLAGNTRFTLGTLLAGEDQTNNLIQTSGGKVRQTVIVTGAVGDATGTAVEVPSGKKRIEATITGAGAVVQTIKLYGGTAVGMAAATSALLCTINLNGTSGAAGTNDGCNVDTSWSFILPVTSASSGTPTTSVIAMY